MSCEAGPDAPVEAEEQNIIVNINKTEICIGVTNLENFSDSRKQRTTENPSKCGNEPSFGIVISRHTDAVPITERTRSLTRIEIQMGALLSSSFLKRKTVDKEMMIRQK